MFAARAQLVRELIRPALDAGQLGAVGSLHRRELRVSGRAAAGSRTRASRTSKRGRRR